MTKLYWHWLKEDRRLRYDSKELVEVGKTITHTGLVVMCESGLHASERAIDSLQYAPGPIICRVTLGGTVIDGTDKSVASERTVLWMADATNTLHEFACLCAEEALRTAKVENVRCWNAINTKRKWLRGEATNEELSAAESAAWTAAGSAAWTAASGAAWSAAGSAAWTAASGAAWSAAESEAWSAARSAAWAAASGAAWDAAWDAARDAAMEKQNTRLTDMLLSLEPKEEK
jgi:hypothetical protein